jgi:hypothetical protein
MRASRWALALSWGTGVAIGIALTGLAELWSPPAARPVADHRDLQGRARPVEIVGDVGDPAPRPNLLNPPCEDRPIPPRHRREVPALANVVLTSSLDNEPILRVMRRNRNQIRYCYEVELIRFPRQQGRLTVKFAISPRGSVESPTITQSNVGNADLESCIAGRIRTWVFPRPTIDSTVIVTYPINLEELLR